MDGSLRPRCAACAPRPVPPAPRSRALPSARSGWCPSQGRRPSARTRPSSPCFARRSAAASGPGEGRKAGGQRKTRLERPAQTEARPSPIFYTPGSGHAHPGTEPIVTRGLRPPKVALRGRGARWGRGRGKSWLLERGGRESSRGGEAPKTLLSPPHADGRVVPAETQNARRSEAPPPRNAACERLRGARRSGALKAGVRPGARCVSSFLPMRLNL